MRLVVVSVLSFIIPVDRNGIHIQPAKILVPLVVRNSLLEQVVEANQGGPADPAGP